MKMRIQEALFMVCYFLRPVVSIQWDRVHCSADGDQSVSEGKVPDIGRFPWLAVVQHSFYLGGKTRFAVTTAVLIHPAYAIAPAEDIARIQPEALQNNTKFIVWQRQSVKYTMDVADYYLHPEYEARTTFASLALLQLATLGETGFSDAVAPVLPICMPIKGSGVFSDLYAVKMTDDNGELQKEMLKMNFVENKDCEEFYFRAKLNYKKMSPVNSICAVSKKQKHSCVWDGGVALISRQSWGYWKLIGFSVRGPGCGAPARFLNIHDYIMWIDEVISSYPYNTREDDTHAFVLRRLSPVKLIMYKADVRLPRDTGMCDRKQRGNVLYKDNSEILVNKNFAQGFFFVSIADVAQVNCATIVLDVSSRTNLAVWLEHLCQKDLTGERQGIIKKNKLYKDVRQMECFLYFKSVAYMEFRFYFSFKALLEVTLYGNKEVPKRIPSPFRESENTESWWPTDMIIRWGYFVPYYVWWYHL